VAVVRRQPIQHRLGLHVNRHAGSLRQRDQLGELAVLAHHEEPQERPSPGAKRLPDRVEAVQDLLGLTVSSGSSHPADPQS
jgi:hypothetical protein